MQMNRILKFSTIILAGLGLFLFFTYSRDFNFSGDLQPSAELAAVQTTPAPAPTARSHTRNGVITWSPSRSTSNGNAACVGPPQWLSARCGLAPCSRGDGHRLDEPRHPDPGHTASDDAASRDVVAARDGGALLTNDYGLNAAGRPMTTHDYGDYTPRRLAGDADEGD